MELMRLISMYAASYDLMMCRFIERMQSKMKTRLRTILEDSMSLFLREVYAGAVM